MATDLIAQDLAAQARAAAAAALSALAEKPSSNFSPVTMAAWNRAKARVRAGLADATIAFVGDSTTVGHGAGDDPIANFTNARGRSMPSRVAQQFALLGLPTHAEAVFGGNTIDAASATITKLPLYNPALAIASGGTSKWYFANEYSLGGRVLRGAGASTDPYSLTPSIPFDTIDLWYAGGSGSGSFTVDIGGAALQSVTIFSSTPLTKLSIPTGGAAAAGTITIRNTGGSYVRLIGVVPRASGTKRALVCNLGWEGAQASDWVSAPGGYGPVGTATWAPEKALATLAPDLTVIKLGANDLAAAVPVATVRANLTALVGAAKAGGGSCVLAVPTPQNPATRDPAGLTIAYNAMIRQLAVDAGCGLIDLHARYVSWGSAAALGYFADDVHSLPIGYANEADVIARTLFGS